MKIKNAVVVDDSKSARFAMRKALETRHIDVQTLEDAEACYAFLNEKKPDVIFLDHVMPSINGLDVLRHLRAETATANIPVVLCSSHDTAEFLAQARALGANDVLIKPPSTAQLDQVILSIEKAAAQAAAQQVPKPSIVNRVVTPIRDMLAPPPPRREDNVPDINAEIEHLRSQAARLQERLAQTPQEPALPNLTQLMQRFDQLEKKIDVRLNELQVMLELGLRVQSERLQRINEALEHARPKAESPAPPAASPVVSDQFMNSLISALRGGNGGFKS